MGVDRNRSSVAWIPALVRTWIRGWWSLTVFVVGLVKAFFLVVAILFLRIWLWW